MSLSIKFIIKVSSFLYYFSLFSNFIYAHASSSQTAVAIPSILYCKYYNLLYIISKSAALTIPLLPMPTSHTNIVILNLSPSQLTLYFSYVLPAMKLAASLLDTLMKIWQVNNPQIKRTFSSRSSKRTVSQAARLNRPQQLGGSGARQPLLVLNPARDAELRIERPSVLNSDFISQLISHTAAVWNVHDRVTRDSL